MPEFEAVKSATRLTPRALSLRYVAALALIALLTLAGQGVVQYQMMLQEDDASTVNLAGRQRMLVLGISRAALALASDPHPEHRQGAFERLARDLEEWERVHAALVHGDPGRGLTGENSPQALELLARIEPLRRAIGEAAQACLERSRTDCPLEEREARSDYIIAQGEAYLPLMDQLTGLYERESRGRVDGLRRLELLLAGLTILVLVLEALFIFRPITGRIRSDMFRLTALAEEMRALSMKDGLTGAFNRRHFEEQLEREWRRAAREDQPLALVMLDIDHFKAFNDAHGHQAGDQALRAVTEAAAAQAHRGADLLARYGGEEFALILPQTGLEGALKVAERIRLGVRGLAIAHGASPTAKVLTISLGVAVARPARQEDAGVLVASADQALYRAKEGGRDQVGGPPGAAAEDWS